MSGRLSLFLPLLGLVLIVLSSYGAPIIAPHDPTTMDIAGRLKPPSQEFLLGQDQYGRDILSRLLFGGRVSLTVAIIASTCALIIGASLGLIGGYFRGLSEYLTLRIVDVILSFPPILLALLIVTLFGPGAVTLTACLALLFSPGFARVVYGETLSTRNLDYVEASRALGAGSFRIILGTILPNIIGPIIVQYSLTISSAILIESGLSFLGLGVVPPDPSWGVMIRAARGYMSYSPLGLVWPCLALTITVLIFNGLCDGLRDFFDPKTRVSLKSPKILKPKSYSDSPVNLLDVKNLSTYIQTQKGVIKAVNDVSFNLAPGETTAIVGESGSGKTMIGLSIMALYPEPAARITGGQIKLRTRKKDIQEITNSDSKNLENIRGDDISMIFQEPMTALNPVYRIGDQIVEAVLKHRDLDRDVAIELAIETLEKVGIPEPRQRVMSYPHELSGGMRQRAMIAMALVLEPSLIIADEPTTALDVTIQAQILDLLKEVQNNSDPPLAMIFITHNLGVVAEVADRVMVLYCGKIMEEGAVDEIFSNPLHPYTKGLLESIPQSGSGRKLKAIPGNLPDPLTIQNGCSFSDRCELVQDVCKESEVELYKVGQNRFSRCIFWEKINESNIT